VFENHEVIDEEDRFALEQFPDSFQPLSLGLDQHRHVIATSRVRHQIHPVNVLYIDARKIHVAKRWKIFNTDTVVKLSEINDQLIGVAFQLFSSTVWYVYVFVFRQLVRDNLCIKARPVYFQWKCLESYLSAEAFADYWQSATVGASVR